MRQLAARVADCIIRNRLVITDTLTFGEMVEAAPSPVRFAELTLVVFAPWHEEILDVS